MWREVFDLAKYNSSRWAFIDKMFKIYSFWVTFSNWGGFLYKFLNGLVACVLGTYKVLGWFLQKTDNAWLVQVLSYTRWSSI